MNIKIHLHIWMNPNYKAPALFRTCISKTFLPETKKQEMELSLIRICTCLSLPGPGQAEAVASCAGLIWIFCFDLMLALKDYVS